MLWTSGLLIRVHRFSPLNPAGEGLAGFWNLPCGFHFWLFKPLLVALHRAPIEEGTPLNGRRLVVNITHDVSLGLQSDLATSDRTLDRPIHDYSFGLKWCL